MPRPMAALILRCSWTRSQLGDASCPRLSADVGGVVPPPRPATVVLQQLFRGPHVHLPGLSGSLTVLPGPELLLPQLMELLFCNLSAALLTPSLARLVVALGHGVLQVLLRLCVQPLSRHRLRDDLSRVNKGKRIRYTCSRFLCSLKVAQQPQN